MSTLRISNIEAKANGSSPSVDEKLKFTNSSGDVLVHLDGKTSGITTIGINTTAESLKFDSNNNIYSTGIITATKFSGIIDATTASFSGDVSIGGTLTYQDVTNIDSVGIITARSDIRGGRNLNVTGLSTFSDHIRIADSKKILLGNLAAGDCQFIHDGNDTFIQNKTGDLKIANNVAGDVGGNIIIQAMNGENSINCVHDAQVELSFNGTKRLSTSGIGVTVTGTIDVDTISKSISKTAVDIFVYDTRKDSDGGAWRKRTSHTSWYNETLGSSTRGSRKEFPAVALIVAETGTLTIYDGDDPELPMWMVFEVNTVGTDLFINDSSSSLTSIAALNGRIFVGSTRTSTTGNLTGIDFIGDRGGMVYTSSADIRTYSAGIGQRNDGSGNWLAGTSNWFTKGPIVNRNVNDVAMTVLPNAPTDDVTGILIPTIVLTTAGGVTVIKDDGYAYDIQQSLNWKNVNIGEVKGRKVANYTFSTGGTVRHTYLDNIGLDAGNNIAYEDYPFAQPSYESTNGPRGGDVYGNDTKGLAIYDRWDDPGSYNNADYDDLLTYITSESNSGWMYGDIKGAWLADTDDTNITGTSLIANGDFSSSSTAAFTTVAGGTAAVVGGLLKLTDTGGAFCYASAPFTTVVGNQYFVTVDIVNNSNTAPSNYIRCGNSHNGTEFHNTNYGTGYGTKTFYFTATATTTYLTLISGHGAGNPFGHWDNVFVYKLDNDRSKNTKGLRPHGTIIKTAVATGADLVAYSGNGGTNYLEQAYNSDLAFGTNEEFTAMGWLYTTNVGGGQIIFDRSVTHNSSRDFQSWVAADLRYMTLYIGQTQTVNTGNNAFENNQWFHFCCFRRKGNAYIYINGEQKGHGAGSTNTSVASGNRSMKILYDMNSNTKMALFRFSKGAPTDEQIKKIYEDEKRLFAPNAKCTLYGSSDEILALAYDDSTDIIHAGTSAGRSEFVGLNRINNTTTAVATAISASNGFVADE